MDGREERGAGGGVGPHGKEDVELTAAERRAFDALAREREPSALLEERVVRALRREGMVRPRRSGAEGRWRARRAAWVVAAGLALFLGGAVVGHQVGARTTTEAFLAVREQDAALRVQEAGTAYVRALTALDALRIERGDVEAVGQGTQAASATLHAAARVLARLDPGDPSAALLARLLEERLGAGTTDGSGVRRTFWF